MEWISLNDRLPEIDGKYIVAYTNNSKSITVALFSRMDSLFTHIRTGAEFMTITHWMPLPKPPTQ
jgi:hypothetical protein